MASSVILHDSHCSTSRFEKSEREVPAWTIRPCLIPSENKEYSPGFLKTSDEWLGIGTLSGLEILKAIANSSVGFNSIFSATIEWYLSSSYRWKPCSFSRLTAAGWEVSMRTFQCCWWLKSLKVRAQRPADQTSISLPVRHLWFLL